MLLNSYSKFNVNLRKEYKHLKTFNLMIKKEVHSLIGLILLFFCISSIFLFHSFFVYALICMPSGPCVTIDPVTGAETASDWGYKQESYQFYLPEPESEDAVGPLKTIQRITNLDSGQQVVRTTLGYNLDGKKAYKSRYKKKKKK